MVPPTILFQSLESRAAVLREGKTCQWELESVLCPSGGGGGAEWTGSDSPGRLRRRRNARPSCPSCSGQCSLQPWLSGPLSLLWLRTSRLPLLCVRYQRLEEASASLRERIRHLDDMVHCQQKKVKQMVEEVSPCGRLRARRAACRGDTSAREPALTLSSVFCGSRVNVLSPLSSWPRGKFPHLPPPPLPRDQ